MSNHMHNPSDHDEIAEMLPWFVNRTLDADQRKSVSRHLEHCIECQREIQFLKTLNEAVQHDAQEKLTNNTDVDKSLASVMERIDGNNQHNNLAMSAVSWVKRNLGSIFQFTENLTFPQWSATALAGLLVVVLGFQWYNGKVDSDYTVLSSSDNENVSMRLSVQPTLAANESQVLSIFKIEANKLGRSIDVVNHSDGTYIIEIENPVGVHELSKFVTALENNSVIERVEILP
ncbi:MAG: anti-sigma factor [Granulosicoccus sp.]